MVEGIVDFLLLTNAGDVNAATPGEEDDDNVTTKAAAIAEQLNFI